MERGRLVIKNKTTPAIKWRSNAKTRRSKAHRFQRRIIKRWQAIIAQEITKERRSIKDQENNIIRSLKKETWTNFDFDPNLDLSTIQNVSIVIGRIITWHYFSRPNHLVFYNLTKGKVISNIAKQVLGLSWKFIPVNTHSIEANKLEQSFQDYERDSHPKTFF